jgi:hypothetical protein
MHAAALGDPVFNEIPVLQDVGEVQISLSIRYRKLNLGDAMFKKI